MSWNEWTEMNQLKWMNWHEGIEMNGLTFLHEWIDMNELQGMNCQKSSDPLSFLWFLSEIELSLQSRPFCRPHRPKWSEAPEVFYDFMWSTTWWRCGWHMKPSSRYSLVHILSASSSKSGLRPSAFSRFLCEIELSLVSCTFCRPLSPIEPRTRGNKDRPAATTGGHFTRKNTGFAPESVFKRDFTRCRSLTLPNYIMMMWLT